jgi:hypothetical protein
VLFDVRETEKERRREGEKERERGREEKESWEIGNYKQHLNSLYLLRKEIQLEKWLYFKILVLKKRKRPVLKIQH